MRPNGGGFTLIEILLVVAIIALLAAAAGPIFIGTYKRHSIEKSARQLLLAAKYARTIAIERQASCYLRLDKDKHRYTISMQVPDRDADRMVETVIKDNYFKPTELGKSITFEKIAVAPRRIQSEPAAPDAITFYSDGSADMALVQIGDGRRHYHLRIAAATGRGRLQRGPADEAKPDIIDLDRL